MQAFQNLGANLDDYLRSIIPPVMKLFEPADVPLAVCICAVETQIIHPFVRQDEHVMQLFGSVNSLFLQIHLAVI